MNLYLYNTWTNKKEEFIPIREGKVYMYVCGLTPYDHAHIGHARTMVAFDTLKRVLMFLGYDVLHIQNITDVDDKILKRAVETGKDPLVLAEHFHERALKGFDALNILRADVYPKVSDHIPEIIETTERIIANGFAYVVDSGVYFDVMKYQEEFGTYGHLSGQRLEEIAEKHRIEPAPDKKNPLDFALWKRTKPSEEPIGWESPWGYGRPGWHIECSVMSFAYTNKETLDIHGGAKDLIFPHHENEIAQSQAAYKKQFVKYWLHSGFLTINGEKMSKSLGNFVTLEDALKKYHPMALRLLFLSSKYSSPIDFSESEVEEKTRFYQRILLARENLRSSLEKPVYKADFKNVWERWEKLYSLWKEFLSAMLDDLDTPRALAAFSSFISEVNRGDLPSSLAHKSSVLFERMLFLLGIKVEEEERDLREAIIEVRELFRKEKRYDVSDRIREVFSRHGYQFLDDKEGTRLVKKP